MEPDYHSNSRLRAVLYMLSPAHLRELITFNPQPSWKNAGLAGLQASIACALALPLVYLSPYSHLIGFAAMGSLAALFGRFASRERRNHVVMICAVLLTSGVAVMSTATWLGAPYLLMLTLLAISCAVFYYFTVSSDLGAPGAVIFVFTAGAAMSHVDSFGAVIERVVATASVSILALIVCALTEAWRTPSTDDHPLPSEPYQPTRARMLSAGRVGVGAVIAITCSNMFLHAPHPAWAAMGAIAVMQGAHLHITLHRAMHRMVGTCLGAGLAWIVLSFDPSVWTVITIMLALMVGTEAIIGSNYGLGQMLMTPMALLMTYLASPQSEGATIAVERIGDTVVGATIGLLTALVFSTAADREKFMAHTQQRAGR